MKAIHCEWNGASPLIMHSSKTVNPLHPLSVKLKKLTSNKKKSEDDLLKISDLEWEASLYYEPGIGLYIPSENIEASVREGAKARKKGKDIEKAFNVTAMQVPLDIGERLTLDEMRSDYRFRDTRAMRVKMARVVRTRGLFNKWRIEFDATYNESLIDFETVLDSMEYAGQFVGICDSRPKHGKFVPKVWALD